MSLQVYKNDTDQILLGSSGNVFRVPYNFTDGKSYSSTMKLNIDISSLSDIMTVIELGNLDSGELALGQVLFNEESYYSKLAIFSNDSFYVSSTIGISGYPSSTTTGTVKSLSNPRMAVSEYSLTDQVMRYFGTTNKDFSDYDSISISDLTYYTFKTGYGRGTHGVNERYGRTIIFSRELSSSELEYFYNNGSYSELQSSNCLFCDILQDEAEILDFSGNDYTYDSEDIPTDADFAVGCRDSSGNGNHGSILNLPSGTLAEQLTYANSNLFTTFLN